MADAEDELTPIRMLIDELRNEDSMIRLKAIRRLSVIAGALGPDRTRAELVPYLNEIAGELEDEDEVLLALAEELAHLVDHVGGVERAHCLLLPLETLVAMEEAAVRDKAVETVGKLCKIVPKSHLADHMLPLLRRLSTSDFNTTRMAAAPIFAFVYKQLPTPAQAELRGLFSQLCRDNAPLVRKAACGGLGALAATMDVDLVQAEVVPLFVKLAQDDQDSVRILAVDNCVALGKSLPSAQVQSQVLPLIRNLTQDKSWRVRFMVADKFTDLCDAVGTLVAEAEMLPALVRLLRDAEPEVRTAAAFKVASGCERLDSQLALQQVLPSVRELTVDTSQHVRGALASVIMSLAPVFGKDPTIEHLLPLFLQLLKDEFHEVRLNIIANLEHVNKVIGVQRLSQSLLPAVIDLAEDKQWRVRLAIIEHIPLLAQQLGVDFFDQQLSRLCMMWLADSVYSVREAATANLAKLAKVFGSDWTKKNIVPPVVELAQHNNYLYRMTSMFAIRGLVTNVNTDTLLLMLPAVVKAAKDPVPNVRFNATKALEAAIGNVDASVIKTQIKPCLESQQTDVDPDVKYFSAVALKACKC